MDELLEVPDAAAVATVLDITNIPPEENEQASDDEDDGLDWTKLLPPAQRPVIPKRGEKEYEPRAGGGSNLQLHVLERSRAAMFETLKTKRTTSSKVISYAVWHPTLARAEVTLTRGIHFASMGHSAPRTIIGEDGTEKLQKRLELLPEEAIYLIERGSMFCWKKVDYDVTKHEGLNYVQGAPMSVQQAYAEMIGRDDLTLEKLQVFTYLKRLGYVVTRSDPPTPYYPTPPKSLTQTLKTSLQPVSNLFTLFTRVFARIFQRVNWWHPLRFSYFGKHDKSYRHIYSSLRLIPAGHSTPLREINLPIRKQSPYQIFYNVYKPSTPFKKSSPGPPDFQIVVVNARTTTMPTLRELTDLFDVSPELPPPVPRQRYNPTQQASKLAPPPAPVPQAPPAQVTEPTFVKRVFPWFFPAPQKVGALTTPTRPPNPFMMLKSGKKMVVIAAVDSGSTSFFRVSQGAFEEWPMA
ncbi:hypothetical protein FA15DRAFT_635476 [Coprinopsis marcescibilis]|uniref:tRNA-splicing endonuclease subunit Sen54 N-terminal domain-containing protein n=1 Tax=Coprinopsis marcescibilis TaxID=230819 RepID=A0A5C3L3K0_COPMA|nr:hypothetical protein FA15DRAFT_635476 [Coprinopsis marcescibilis]